MSKKKVLHGSQTGLSFTINSDVLQKVLPLVATATSKQGNQKYIKIESEGNGVAFSANKSPFDLKRSNSKGNDVVDGIAVRYSVTESDGVEIKSHGAIAVSAEEILAARRMCTDTGKILISAYSASKEELEKFSKVVETEEETEGNESDTGLVGKAIVFFPRKEGQEATCDSDKFCTLPVANPDILDRPNMSLDTTPITVKASDLQDVILRVAAISEENTSFKAHRAIELRIGNNAIQASGNQSNIMIFACKTDVNVSCEPVKFYIMGKPLQAMFSKISPDSNIDIKTDNGRIVFSTGGLTFILYSIIDKSIEERYVTLQKIIETPGDGNEVTVFQKKFMECIEKANMAGYLGITSLSFNIKENLINIKGSDSSKVMNAQSSFEGTGITEDMAELVVNYNLNDLKRVVASLPVVETRTLFRGADKATLFRANEDNISVVALIQPRTIAV